MRERIFSPVARNQQQHGAAAVEFAFVVIPLLLIVAGVIGFGRTFWYADALTKSTRDGARLLSTWPIATIESSGVNAARTITINTANAANISPQLGAGNVLVECLNSSFEVVACVDDTAPANVRVSIKDFNVTLGEWFAFIYQSNVISYGVVGISPHTTMRYMN